MWLSLCSCICLFHKAECVEHNDLFQYLVVNVGYSRRFQWIVMPAD